MCYVVLRQLLVFVFILSVRGIGIPLHKIVDLRCFKCGIPQPRSVVVAQEIEIVQETAPYMAILHRCDAGSGCCSKGFICKVAKKETLNATVFVKNQDKYVKRFFEITNHTECSCQSLSDIPK
ncbi:unnamed protein product [Tenebrio molitor]|nr:unnamed protein product [Tenebrio molitor]